MGEPKITTRYQDLFQTTAAGSDVNQLVLIGPSESGQLNKLLSYSGLSGLQAAEDEFGTKGRLPKAIREALMVAANRDMPVTVHAMRIGEVDEEEDQKASVVLQDSTGDDTLKISYEYYGLEGNDWSVDVDENDGKYELVLSNDDLEYVYTGSSVSSIISDFDSKGGPFEFKTLAGDETLSYPESQDLAGASSLGISDDEIDNSLTMLQGTDYPCFMFTGLFDTDEEDIAGYALEMTIAHCSNQLTEFDVERFAFLELPSMDSTATEGSKDYFSDMQDWVEGLGEFSDKLNNRNIIAFAGDGDFFDGNGKTYEAPLAVTCAAAWLGLPIHRSMINQQVHTIQKLVPEITPALRQELVSAGLNYVRNQVGRGLVIGNSNTMADHTSDYINAEVLRTVYTCGSEARKAGVPVWGRPDDPVTHDGLETLKAMMSKPLEARKGTTIVDYVIEPTIDDAGVVKADMGIVAYQTMKTINHVVYVKRS